MAQQFQYQPQHYQYHTSHYPLHTQYNQAAAVQHHQLSPLKPPSPPALPVPPPKLSSVTPKIASRAIQKLIAIELKDGGYDSAQSAALQRLEVEVTACQFPPASSSYKWTFTTWNPQSSRDFFCAHMNMRISQTELDPSRKICCWHAGRKSSSRKRCIAWL